MLGGLKIKSNMFSVNVVEIIMINNIVIAKFFFCAPTNADNMCREPRHTSSPATTCPATIFIVTDVLMSRDNNSEENHSDCGD